MHKEVSMLRTDVEYIRTSFQAFITLGGDGTRRGGEYEKMQLHPQQNQFFKIGNLFVISREMVCFCLCVQPVYLLLPLSM